MARSMILGITTLSPRPLDDVPMEEEADPNAVVADTFDVRKGG